jgi:hypothetical protein
VGQFREWLLAYETTGEVLAGIAPGVTPEMAAAVSKLMRNQDLVLVASKIRVRTAFRNTLGLPGRLSIRLQPNHPTDDPKGIAASILDGLLMGCGDAVIGINPASDNVASLEHLTQLTGELIERYAIPTQSCVLGHITTLVSEQLRGCAAIVVESNHSRDMLKACDSYPWELKQRILSRLGHLSNEDLADWIKDGFDGCAKYIVLAHLSQRANNPYLAKITAEVALQEKTPLFPCDTEVFMSYPKEPTPWIEV